MAVSKGKVKFYLDVIFINQTNQKKREIYDVSLINTVSLSELLMNIVYTGLKVVKRRKIISVS